MSKTVKDLYNAAAATASPGAGLCATWTSRVAAKIGINMWGNACCQYWNYCDKDLNAIREGMLVAVPQTKSSHGGPRGCGHYGYGHVGYYLGGQVWSSVTASGGGGTVIKESLEAFKSRAYTGCTVKCGWAGGVELTGTSGQSATSGKSKYTAALSCSALPVLYHGKTGTTVKALQAILVRCWGASISVDGSFGTATQAAVKAFQKARGLTQDGVCGPATWAKLFGVNSTLDVMTTGFDIRQEVKALQAVLAGAWRYSLNVDGYYGNNTATCVKTFQKARGLTVDNYVGGATWKKLLGMS